MSPLGSDDEGDAAAKEAHQKKLAEAKQKREEQQMKKNAEKAKKAAMPAGPVEAMLRALKYTKVIKQ